jgi:hypothetical protein
VLLGIGNLLQTRRLHLELRGQGQLLKQRVRERTAQLQAAHNEILQRLALAAEYRDDEPTSTPCASANRRHCSARPTDCSTATSATTSPPACSPATKTAASQLAGRCLCHQIAQHQGLTAVTTHRSQTDSIRS